MRRFQKYFEVRWAEFTAALLDAIMFSWQEKAQKQESKSGLAKFLQTTIKKKERLRRKS